MDNEDRPFHFFPCAAKVCKLPSKGVRRYQDTQDASSTRNLRTHADKCFGEGVVAARMAGVKSQAKDGSIYAAFARSGQRPVNVTHRTHTNPERR